MDEKITIIGEQTMILGEKVRHIIDYIYIGHQYSVYGESKTKRDARKAAFCQFIKHINQPHAEEAGSIGPLIRRQMSERSKRLG